MKKILTLFLVQVMVITCFAFSVSAQQAEENPKLTDNANSWRYKDGEVIKDQYGVSLVTEDAYHPNATFTGIDVSKHQGVIDWEKVKAAGIDFAIIRCGYAEDKPEYDDTRWHYNASECERLGIPYGVYLYSYAFNEAEAESEADHVLRLIEGYNPSLPIYYDMEDNSTLQYDHVAMANAFCQKISDAGYPVGIYASKYWWETYLADTSLDRWYRWVAQWNSECTYNGRYEIWQYYNQGRIDGINTDVDMNFLIGYPEDHNVGTAVELETPQITLSNVAVTGKTKLSWNRVNLAQRYEIYRKSASENDYTLAATTNRIYYTDTSAQAGVEYSYKVRAVYEDNYTVKSDFSTPQSIVCRLPQVKVKILKDNETDEIKLNWTPVDGAESYIVYRADGWNSEYEKVKTTTDTSYTDTADDNTYYRVVATHKNSAANSAYSDITGKNYSQPKVTVHTFNLTATGTQQFSWQQVTSATSYEVYCSTSRYGSYRLVSITTDTFFTNQNAVSDKTYYYLVKAVYSPRAKHGFTTLH